MYTAKNHTEGPDKYVVGGELHYEDAVHITAGKNGIGAIPIHFYVSADDAIAASNDAVHAAINLGTAVQNIETGITDPAVPRALRIKGSAAGITGNVIITGFNIEDAEITETIALNGVNAVEGAKAFKEVYKITLPAQSHTPVAQVETATAAGTVSTAGNASVTVKSNLFTADEVVTVPVLLNDNAAAIALAIRTALAANENVSDNFTVSGATDKIILTAKVIAANDTTLNIAIADGTGEGASVGVTTAASSANTTAGVAYDTVSVGFNDKLGLPCLLSHNTVLYTFVDNAIEATAATVTVSATAIESNTLDPNTALSGKAVDAYFFI